jgi:hypothetical protein
LKVPLTPSRWFAIPILAGKAVFNRGNVQPRNGRTALIIKPTNDSASSRIESNVIRRVDRIAPPACGYNREGLKRRSFTVTVLADISNHRD